MVEEQPKNNLGGATGKGWLPGQSGNPGGRPRGKSITAKLRKILDSEYTDGKTVADHIVDTIVKEVLDPSGKYGFNTPLLKELLDRTEGKVTLPIGGDKENPIYTITVSSEEGKKDIERLLKGERT